MPHGEFGGGVSHIFQPPWSGPNILLGGGGGDSLPGPSKCQTQPHTGFSAHGAVLAVMAGHRGSSGGGKRPP